MEMSHSELAGGLASAADTAVSPGAGRPGDWAPNESRLADAIPTMVLAISTEFDVTYANPAAASLLGRRRSELVGRKCFDLFRTSDCRTSRCVCAGAMETRRPRTAETIVEPEGRAIPIRCTGAPLYDERGQVVGAVKYAVDITAETRVRAQVAEELGIAVSAIGSRSSAVEEECNAVAEKTHGVAAAAEQHSLNMTTPAASAEESERNVSSVAGATEQLSATVADVAERAEVARGVAERAVRSVIVAGERVSTLGEAAKDIGQFTDIIREIAEQTKLLALNATIEAARAGEAGKGFAVVASEVKELAKETNGATADIRTKIEAIREATLAAIEEIDNITGIISDVSDFVTTIAASTEEQSLTTRDISTSISEVSTAMADVARNTSQAAAVTREVTETVAEANVAVGRIRELAAAMSQAGQGLQQTRAHLDWVVAGEAERSA